MGLLERETELATLSRLFASATSGRGGVALVSGEAGIGKTSLVRAGLSALPPKMRVLRGACDDLIAPRTFGPLHDAARGAPWPLASAVTGGADRDAVFDAVFTGLGVARIPRGPRPQTRDNAAGLTERQHEVVGLLAQGLSNAEIAQRLVVSVRTVDHHVAAELGKLGVTSRRHAARRAAELGLT